MLIQLYLILLYNDFVSNIFVGTDGKLHKIQGGADSVLPFKSAETLFNNIESFNSSDKGSGLCSISVPNIQKCWIFTFYNGYGVTNFKNFKDSTPPGNPSTNKVIIKTFKTFGATNQNSFLYLFECTDMANQSFTIKVPQTTAGSSSLSGFVFY